MTTKDTRFKKGVSGNPKGRPSVPKDIKDARNLNKVELSKILNGYIFLTDEELKRKISDPDVPIVEKIVAKTLMEALKVGCYRRLEFIFDRLIGKEAVQRQVVPLTQLAKEPGFIDQLFDIPGIGHACYMKLTEVLNLQEREVEYARRMGEEDVEAQETHDLKS